MLRAHAYGVLRAQLQARRHTDRSARLLIAGHAISLGVKPVTNNVREFSHVSGLRIENWLAP